jgi:hypothetical protein
MSPSRERKVCRVCIPCETGWVGETPCWVCGGPPTDQRDVAPYVSLNMGATITAVLLRARQAARRAA